jgi:hypothetical protein
VTGICAGFQGDIDGRAPYWFVHQVSFKETAFGMVVIADLGTVSAATLYAINDNDSADLVLSLVLHGLLYRLFGELTFHGSSVCRGRVGPCNAQV